MLKIFLRLRVATFSELHDAMANGWKRKRKLTTTTTTNRSKIILDTHEKYPKTGFLLF